MKQTFLENIEDIVNLIEAESVMIVCDSFFEKQKVVLDLISKLSLNNIKTIVFTEFEPNPKYESIKKALDIFEENVCKFIIAIGGGSAIDVAKCIKAYAGMDRNFEYINQTIAKNGVKMLAVPTTAGTGSESTKFAVMYYEGEKQSVNSEYILPEYIALVPELLVTLPKYQKICTAMDALCHSIESMWSMHSNEESVRYSKQAITMIKDNLSKFVEGDEKAAGKMLEASNLAGRAINITTTTAGHAMCYKITSLYNIPHGHAAIICLPKLWRYMNENKEKCVDKRGVAHLENIFLEIAESIVNEKNVEKAIKYIEKLTEDNGLEIPEMTNENELEILVKSVNVERLGNNPVKLEDDDLRMIYKKIFKID